LKGVWYILHSSDGSLASVQWGVTGDMPVPGDYDGDGKFDITVWRSSTGAWYIVRSSDGTIQVQTFGINGDLPLPSAYIR
jgi:hypothetical protein